LRCACLRQVGQQRRADHKCACWKEPGELLPGAVLLPFNAALTVFYSDIHFLQLSSFQLHIDDGFCYFDKKSCHLEIKSLVYLLKNVHSGSCSSIARADYSYLPETSAPQLRLVDYPSPGGEPAQNCVHGARESCPSCHQGEGL
jgi:hypothetical protein